MNRKSFVTVAVLVALTSFLTVAAYAQAETTTVTATVLAPAGTRILQPINAPSAIAFTSSTSGSTIFSATAVETLADGVADWYVTLSASDFARAGGGGSIAASALSYTGVTNTATALGELSGTIQAGSNGALNDAGQTMFRVTGETPGAFPGYTGTYTGAGNMSLNLPAGTPSGVYTATVTVTLIA